VRDSKRGAIKGAVDLNGYRSSSSYIAGTQNVHRAVNWYWNRHEFDGEHWDDGELLIADLTPGDVEEDEAECMKLVAEYEAVLRMREFVKDFVLDRKLLLFHDKKQQKAKRSKDAEAQIRKELLDKLKPFSKYFDGTAEYLRFVETNVMVKAARMPIDRYIEWRRSGCRTMDDIERRRREQEADSRLRLNLRPKHSKKRTRCLWQIEDSDSPNDYPFGSVDGDLEVDTPWNGSSPRPHAELEATAPAKRRKFADPLFSAKMRNENESAMAIHSALGMPSASTPSSTLPAAVLLSRTESSFVNHCGILPAQYMQYKDIILMKQCQNGKVSKQTLRSLFPYFTE